MAVDSSDEHLIARIQDGDQEAFACLLRRHLDSIHRFADRTVGNSADAEDLAQDTFVRVWQKAHTFVPGKAKVTTWIHTIAHNLCIDMLRKQRGQVAIDTAFDQGLADANGAPDQRAQQVQLASTLRTAITRLPPAQRSALVLCLVQGLSNKEAADVMGVGLRALESLLARARRTLRTNLSDAAMTEEPS